MYVQHLNLVMRWHCRCALQVLMDMFQQDSVLLNSEDGGGGDPASATATAAANASNATAAGGGGSGMLERQKKSQARMNARFTHFCYRAPLGRHIFQCPSGRALILFH